VTWGKRLYFPSEGRHAEDFFARKIWRLRPGANPWSWVPEASMLTTIPPKPLHTGTLSQHLLQSKVGTQHCEKRLLFSSYLSACPPVSDNSAPTGRIFMKSDTWVFVENLPRKIQVSLQSHNNNGYHTWRPIQIFDHISLNSSFNKNVADNSYRESQNTNFVFNNFFSKIVPFMR
jgi:hypothetical protein